MTTNNDTTVIGRAVYLEMTKDTTVLQLLLMPEGYSKSQRFTPMTCFRRRLTPAAPRKTWRMISAHTTSPAERVSTSGIVGDAERNKAIADKILRFLDPTFSSLSANNYKLSHDPIVVEVTTEDLDCSLTGKTPYKVLGRALKVRKAMGLPADVVPKPGI
jgi:hypothetical protein